MMQTTIFDVIYPQFKIDKPIRLIEFFAGYGSQALALKYLGVPFEHWKICEWAVKSIQAYKDIHFPNEHLTFNSNRKKSEMVEYLYQKGISANYNEPMKKEQIARLSEEQLKTILENIAITHNLVNIQQVKGKDLDIVDSDKYTYLLTYSFPCQDLSLAGKRQGMNDTSTRSGMLWEVERILDECKELGTLPQVLLMENVPQVHGEGNVEDFNKWQLKLESLGYKNYWEDLIATDYGIPQTRNRCFMVSILGDYCYTFPPKQKLKLKLKDMLEDIVDEKYYLSEKGMEYICGNALNKDLKDMYDRNNAVLNRNNAYCLNTKIDRRAGDSNYVLENYDEITIKDFIKIKNATAKGYLEATDGDGVDISSRMEYHRGTVQKDKAQTLSTMGGENVGVVLNDLRIRKLTPKECFRLMGVKDEDYKKVVKNQSNASLYHLAGDSIVVNVLMAIFKELIK